MPSELNKYKDHFSLPETGAYLNCAAQGPMSKAASRAVLASVKDKENPLMMDYEYGVSRVERCREAVAKMISCKVSQVALANSTSWGANLLAQGLDLNTGDEVIAFAGQFPSNIAPWEGLQQRGVTIKKLPCPGYLADTKILKENLSSRTKVATLEWVHFVSGDRIPLKEMTEVCHKNGTLVVVDVTQGLGAIPFDMKDAGVDAVVCSAYKWLYSPYGSGFVALSDSLLEKLKTCNVNWLSLDTNWSDNLADYELNFPTSAKRYDVYSQMGYLNLDGMTASIEWLNTLDIASNFKEVRKLNIQLQEELDPKYFKLLNTLSSDRQSCISTFLCPDVNGEKLIADLKASGFAACIRSRALRVAPSIYNDSKQIAQFCELANTSAAGKN